MSNPYLGEMRWFSFNFAPRGWAACNGQTLSINQNQALFALLGTTYGGDGQTNFALPGMQGRVPIHPGNGFGLGQAGGEVGHTLTVGEMASHSHAANAIGAPGSTASPLGAYWAGSTTGDPLYAAAEPDQAMVAGTVGANGGGQAHPNLQPYLALNLCIALQGIFPPRS